MVSDFLYLVFHLTFNIYHLTLRPTAGRLTAEHAETAEGEESRTYGYNGFGNLISVASTTPQATSEAAYTYSYDGKRISKYIDGTLYDYTYTGSNLLETYADTAGRIAKYTYGHALISQTDATGSSESVVTDYQNSVIATLTPTPTLYAYSPFGKVRYESSSDNPQTLGWLGRQYDSETGNNYLINRYYSSDRGSFLSPDQYQYVQTTIPFTLNLYQYAYANPLVNVDPEGLEVISLQPQSIWDYSYLKYTENPNLLANRTEGTKDYDIISFSDSKSGKFTYYGVWHAKSKRYVYILENDKDLTTFKKERSAYWDSKVIRKIEYLQHMTERELRSRPYEHEATQYMDSMLTGNLGDAARHFGRSWLNAVKDWHWWIDATISTALAYISIAEENQLAARMATRERVAPAIRATRAARAARMRVATATESDTPIMRLLTDERGFVRIRAGSSATNLEQKFYRYVGEREADVIRRTGKIPNVDRELNPKDVYFTNRLYKTAGRAKMYNQLPSRPVYRVEIDPSNVPNRTPFTRVNPSDNPQWGIGGGVEAITRDAIPVNPNSLVRLKGAGL